MTTPASRRWPVIVLATIIAGPVAAQAKKPATPCTDTLTTNSGVYTAAQAVRGKDIYAGFCRSCHTPESHTGPTFHATWDKRYVSDLFSFIRERMPKNEPGSLSDQEYADVLAYLLRMNRMPPGKRELPADSADLTTIRIEPTKSPRRGNQ